jgi:hypothetical protein
MESKTAGLDYSQHGKTAYNAIINGQLLIPYVIIIPYPKEGNYEY